jgi:cephalosporin-C deacetylase
MENSRLSLRRFLERSAAAALLVVALSAASALAASTQSNLDLTITADHADATYRQGETVTFTIKVSPDLLPAEGAQVQWTLSHDGVPPFTKGTARLLDGSATVTGKLDVPGFLQCRAVFQDTNRTNHTALAGAAVDPLQIKPSLPPPADFDQFWAAQKKRLAAVPVNARLTPVTSPVTNVECFDLQADSIGAPVSGYYARPVGAKPRSLPIILTVHAAGVRNSNLSGTAEWAG